MIVIDSEVELETRYLSSPTHPVSIHDVPTFHVAQMFISLTVFGAIML
jgi:hypothetical protein